MHDDNGDLSATQDNQPLNRTFGRFSLIVRQPPFTDLLMQFRPGHVAVTNLVYLWPASILFQATVGEKLYVGRPSTWMIAVSIALMVAVHLHAATFIARRAGAEWLGATLVHITACSVVPVLILAQNLWQPPNSCEAGGWVISDCYPAYGNSSFGTAALVGVLAMIGSAVSGVAIGWLARIALGACEAEPSFALRIARDRP
jgi:hypothetical protein